MFYINKKNILICLGILLVLVIVFNFTMPEENKPDAIEVQTEDKDIHEVFEGFLDMAEEKVNSLTLEEKIGQLFLVRYPGGSGEEALKKYDFGGYLLFEKDFKGKTKEDVISEIGNLDAHTEIPLLIAVDEEGGNIVRISSNKNLADEKFKSPKELYLEGGFERIEDDTIEKSKVLSELCVNLNLAPVVDVATDKNNYIYPRTLGEDTNLTSIFAETVIKASKEGSVSYTLKHFPGYGNNDDTHKGSSTDNKSYEEILERDIPPFRAGIDAGAEAVLVSHNIVSCIDPENPASLSKKMHELLRNELEFTGVIITDDLDMGATSSDEDRVIKSILAGNDLIIVTDYEKGINDTKLAVEAGRISEDLINEATKRVIAWKYYKKMM